MPQSDLRSTATIRIAVFDMEHEEIVRAINALQEAVEAGKDRSETAPLLSKLAALTITHFQSEEAMMAASKYPGLMLHALKHQRLLDQLAAFQSRHGRDSSPMNQHSLKFLRDWVTTHIQNDDLNFGLWQNEHGKR